MPITLQAIIGEAHTRLSVALIANSYNTNLGQLVTRGKRVFKIDELPACSVLLGERSIGEEASGGKRSKISATLTIEAHAVYATAEPEEIAVQLLADIQTAMEIAPETFSSLLLEPGIQWLGDEIFYPEESGNIISVAVTYSIPHLRYFGDPTKPEVI